MKKRIVVIVYSHPEFYPPTLNAISCLSEIAAEIIVVCNNVLPTSWKYPNNVTIRALGTLMTIRAFEQRSFLAKLLRFCQFTFQVWKLTQSADLVIAYDALPLLSANIARRFTNNKHKLYWYHNHDVIELNTVRKYSISWWAAKMEVKVFQWLHIFSLPSKERAQFFPLSTFKGKYFFIPNYPSRQFFQTFSKIEKPRDTINILFQGSIGAGHGIEEICSLLPLRINSKVVQLILKGFVKEEYQKKIEDIARERGALEDIKFVGITPYQEVPETTARCHIGIAIFTGIDIMNQTLGTASNKIYEYAACSLPVLYYDIPHYREHLQQYKWAFATDLSEVSLLDCLSTIANNYEEISATAKNDFQATLNYVQHFKPVLAYLSSKLEEQNLNERN